MNQFWFGQLIYFKRVWTLHQSLVVVLIYVHHERNYIFFSFATFNCKLFLPCLLVEKVYLFIVTFIITKVRLVEDEIISAIWRRLVKMKHNISYI